MALSTIFSNLHEQNLVSICNQVFRYSSSAHHPCSSVGRSGRSLSIDSASQLIYQLIHQLSDINSFWRSTSQSIFRLVCHLLKPLLRFVSTFFAKFSIYWMSSSFISSSSLASSSKKKHRTKMSQNSHKWSKNSRPCDKVFWRCFSIQN